jgi:hypothetical protein
MPPVTYFLLLHMQLGTLRDCVTCMSCSVPFPDRLCSSPFPAMEYPWWLFMFSVVMWVFRQGLCCFSLLYLLLLTQILPGTGWWVGASQAVVSFC